MKMISNAERFFLILPFINVISLDFLCESRKKKCYYKMEKNAQKNKGLYKQDETKVQY